MRIKDRVGGYRLHRLRPHRRWTCWTFQMTQFLHLFRLLLHHLQILILRMVVSTPSVVEHRLQRQPLRPHIVNSRTRITRWGHQLRLRLNHRHSDRSKIHICHPCRRWDRQDSMVDP